MQYEGSSPELSVHANAPSNAPSTELCTLWRKTFYNEKLGHVMKGFLLVSQSLARGLGTAQRKGGA